MKVRLLPHTVRLQACALEDYSLGLLLNISVTICCASVAGLDPGKPTWKLVGVFPVSDGFAQLDLKKLEGKGQTGDTALYIASGESRAAQCVPS